MNRRITELIELYGHEDSDVIFQMSLTGRGNGDNKKAEDYLKKYLMSEEEYNKDWLPIQRKIYQNEDKGLSAGIFRNDFSLIVKTGGILFEEVEFESFQKSVKELGDNNFVVIQNSFGGKLKRPPFRMKYPINITWRELMSGSFISIALLEMPCNEYFVFSEGGFFGKYVANDYDFPMDIIGITPDIDYIFMEQIKQSLNDENRDEILKWLPSIYKRRMY